VSGFSEACGRSTASPIEKEKFAQLRRDNVKIFFSIFSQLYGWFFKVLI
jgi:hypothetical protein